MKLYHCEVLWPKKVSRNIPFGIRRLLYTKHALQQSRQRGVPLPKAVNMEQASVFEAGVNENGSVCHVALRFAVTQNEDMVVAAVPTKEGLVVKTCWTNKKDDQHKTLDKGKYVR